MDPILYLYKYHDGWVELAKAITENDYRFKDYAEDYVQESYIKIIKEDIEWRGEKAAKMYMMRTLKSIILNDIKKARPETVSIEKTMHKLGLDPGEYKDTKALYESLEAIESNLYWFDREMWRLYRSKLSSIRQLSKATKIGHVTVFKTLKRCKDIIRSKLRDEYYGKK